MTVTFKMVTWGPHPFHLFLGGPSSIFLCGHEGISSSLNEVSSSLTISSLFFLHYLDVLFNAVLSEVDRWDLQIIKILLREDLLFFCFCLQLV